MEAAQDNHAQGIREANAVRREVKSLEQLCIDTLLKPTDYHHDFEQIPPLVLETVVHKAAIELHYWRDHLDPPRITPDTLKSLLNPNLRTFSWSLMDGQKRKLKVELWELLKERCHKLETLKCFLKKCKVVVTIEQGRKSLDPIHHLMADLYLFPKLQRLSISNIVYRGYHFEELSCIVPYLRILEITVESMDPCCQEGLCQLTNLEQLSVEHLDNPNWESDERVDFYATLWLMCLLNLPQLQELSAGVNAHEQNFCMSSTLSHLALFGHDKPLQLRKLYLNSDMCDCHYDYHLPSVAGDHFKKLPLHLLSNIDTLVVNQLGYGDVFELFKVLGENITCLEVYWNDKVFDVYSMLSHGPKLEKLVLRYDEDEVEDFACDTNPKSLKLSKNHLSKLKTLDVHFEVSDAQLANFYQIVFESPFLELFRQRGHSDKLDADNATIEALLKTLPNEMLFKKLRRCELELLIDGNNAATVGDTLKQLIPAAPKLVFLKIRVTGSADVDDVPELFKTLRLKEFCEQVPNLRYEAHENCYYTTNLIECANGLVAQ